jgi:hypothetical protein
MKNKFLLIGSAPYMPEWWKARGQQMRAAGYTVAAINNAWAIPKELPEIWIHPNDYAFRTPAALRPSPELVAQMLEVGAALYRDKFGQPIAYSRRNGGTMLLNALTYLLNSSLNNGGCEIVISGCDLQYPLGNSHFYHGGMPDPLRAVIEWIREDLLDIHERHLPAFRAQGYVLDVYNASPLEESVLPFQRK